MLKQVSHVVTMRFDSKSFNVKSNRQVTN